MQRESNCRPTAGFRCFFMVTCNARNASKQLIAIRDIKEVAEMSVIRMETKRFRAGSADRPEITRIKPFFILRKPYNYEYRSIYIHIYVLFTFSLLFLHLKIIRSIKRFYLRPLLGINNFLKVNLIQLLSYYNYLKCQRYINAFHKTTLTRFEFTKDYNLSGYILY